jgi:hypothetical protein
MEMERNQHVMRAYITVKVKMLIRWLHFQGSIFMCHNQGFCDLMIKEIGTGATLHTYDNFLTLIAQDSADAGRYHNIVEAVIWFCSQIEKINPQFFY